MNGDHLVLRRANNGNVAYLTWIAIDWRRNSGIAVSGWSTRLADAWRASKREAEAMSTLVGGALVEAVSVQPLDVARAE